MPGMVQVVGGFALHGQPAQGLITFTPSRLWVVHEGRTWACLAPTVELDAFGQFVVLLTPTDTDSVPWYYLVQSGAGNWVIRPRGTELLHLKDLVDEHHPGPRSTH
jgi:hypothetical protein